MVAGEPGLGEARTGRLERTLPLSTARSPPGQPVAAGASSQVISHQKCVQAVVMIENTQEDRVG